MALVVDASVCIDWCIATERDPRTLHAIAQIGREPAFVPSLWWFEVRNALLIAERHGRVDAAIVALVLAELDALAIEVDRQPESAAVMDLARHHRLSVYDASYVELALRRNATFATLDRQLARAAADAGVGPLAGD